jgi:hypothetical protein
MDQDVSTWHARIPADIDRPEPILWNLTARQLLVITPAVLTGWALLSLLLGRVPTWLLGVIALVLIALAWVLACGRKDGIGLDQMAWLAVHWKATPRRRHPPVPVVNEHGIVDAGGHSALVLACTSVPFHLFSGEEQDQALATFAGFLDALNAPAQILIQRRRMDLTPHVDRLRSGIDDLPMTLRRAARSHAAFLDDLQHNYDLIHHQVLLVLTAPGSPDTAGDALLRRAQDTAAHLGALDIRARVCDCPTAERIIRDSLPPNATTTDREERR